MTIAAKKQPQADDTEWLPQPEITERTGCSASWVHAQGAKGTVRRSKSGTWKGRPVYVYAYADIIREADAGKIQAHQEKLAAARAVPEPASKTLGHGLPMRERAPLRFDPKLFSDQPVLTVDQLRTTLKSNIALGIMTREDAERAAIKLLALD